jgi:hypothetical protein
MKLSEKHRIFIEAYAGNPLEAMRAAGFQGVDAYLEQEGNALLKQPHIVDAIRQRSLYTKSLTKTIATREERQGVWTSIMRNEDPFARPEVNDKGVTKPPENIPLSVRLKASELLGKSETDFIERVDIRQTISISDVIRDAYTVDINDIDAIEVEYEKARSLKNKKDHIIEAELVEHSSESDKPLGNNICTSDLSMFI